MCFNLFNGCGKLPSVVRADNEETEISFGQGPCEFGISYHCRTHNIRNRRRITPEKS